MKTATAMTIYFDKRVFSVFMLGIASGLPWVLIGSALTLWLKEAGVSRSNIGYAGLIFATYTINFLWSPLVDRVHPLPFFGQSKQRQSWIAPCLFIIALLCLSMSFFTPLHQAKTIVFIALLIALTSSTQDIAIDAYRIDSFDPSESGKISAAAGAITAGWWSGYAGIGFIPLYLSDQSWSWPSLYLLLGGITCAIGIMAIFIPSPKYKNRIHSQEEHNRYLHGVQSLGQIKKVKLSALVLAPIGMAFWVFLGSSGLPLSVSSHQAYIPCVILLALTVAVFAALNVAQILRKPIRNPHVVNTPFVNNKRRLENKMYVNRQINNAFDTLLAQLLRSICSPIGNFFQRNGTQLALQILLFIFLFKIGEAFLGRMSIVFYKEIGFSNTEIATYSKMLTWVITVITAIFAGVINAKLGLFKGLLISGLFMACSNLMFVAIAITGPDINVYLATVIIDGVAAAWSTVAFVAFISALCDHRFSASQYALLASLGSLGRTMLSSLSGALVDYLNGNWVVFFIITTVMIIPSMLILIKLNSHNKQVIEANN